MIILIKPSYLYAHNGGKWIVLYAGFNFDRTPVQFDSPVKNTLWGTINLLKSI